MVLAGIDFGSKLSGFTTIAIYNGSSVDVIGTEKGKDADLAIDRVFKNLTSGIVCIDAPLSLPIRYTKPEKGTDYFYRKCDKVLSAMSPMFIGGLTARAIKQADKMRKKGLQVYESYPKALANEFGIITIGYKKENINIPACLSIVKSKTELPLDHIDLNNWHEFDALMCLICAERILKGMNKTYGDDEEGLIYV